MGLNHHHSFTCVFTCLSNNQSFKELVLGVEVEPLGFKLSSLFSCVLRYKLKYLHSNSDHMIFNEFKKLTCIISPLQHSSLKNKLMMNDWFYSFSLKFQVLVSSIQTLLVYAQLWSTNHSWSSFLILVWCPISFSLLVLSLEFPSLLKVNAFLICTFMEVWKFMNAQLTCSFQS